MLVKMGMQFPLLCLVANVEEVYVYRATVESYPYSQC